jgi:hypothetical protein
MKGEQLGRFMSSQFKAGNLGEARIEQMRGLYRLVIEMKAAPAGVTIHESKTQARAQKLADAMRKTGVLAYTRWHAAGWNIKDIAGARKILTKAGEIKGTPARWVRR